MSVMFSGVIWQINGTGQLNVKPEPPVAGEEYRAIYPLPDHIVDNGWPLTIQWHTSSSHYHPGVLIHGIVRSIQGNRGRIQIHVQSPSETNVLWHTQIPGTRSQALNIQNIQCYNATKVLV